MTKYGPDIDEKSSNNMKQAAFVQAAREQAARVHSNQLNEVRQFAQRIQQSEFLRRRIDYMKLMMHRESMKHIEDRESNDSDQLVSEKLIQI